MTIAITLLGCNPLAALAGSIIDGTGTNKGSSGTLVGGAWNATGVVTIVESEPTYTATSTYYAAAYNAGLAAGGILTPPM